ncbi:unnamed protein product, partial [Chrysoparadoxa australica]
VGALFFIDFSGLQSEDDLSIATGRLALGASVAGLSLPFIFLSRAVASWVLSIVLKRLLIVTIAEGEHDLSAWDTLRYLSWNGTILSSAIESWTLLLGTPFYNTFLNA